MAKPLIKWAGGKSKLIDQLLELQPMYFRRVIEPFAGSAAFSLRFPEKLGIVADTNLPLVVFHSVIARLNPTDVFVMADMLDKEYNGLPDMETKSIFYYSARDDLNRLVKKIGTLAGDEYNELAMLFWFINKTCFNGLWRENKSGIFNVPWGKRTSVNLSGHDIDSAHQALRNKQVVQADFRFVVEAAQPGDLVYADPPYHTDSDSFTSYTARGFGAEQHKALAAKLKEAWKRGVHIMASNSDTELVRDLYGSWAELHEVDAHTAISRDPKSRGKRREFIIVAEAS
jgi:DNA adenine methylase